MKFMKTSEKRDWLKAIRRTREKYRKARWSNDGFDRLETYNKEEDEWGNILSESECDLCKVAVKICGFDWNKVLDSLDPEKFTMEVCSKCPISFLGIVDNDELDEEYKNHYCCGIILDQMEKDHNRRVVFKILDEMEQRISKEFRPYKKKGK